MNFDDLKDRLSSELRTTWERLQESTTFNQLRDRYENMSPVMQKLSAVGVVALIFLIILSIPYGYFSTSQEYVSEFEGKRTTIRELLKVSRESAEVPNIPEAPSMDILRSTIEGQITNAQLLPEQIKGTSQVEVSSKLIPKNLSQGALQVNLAKLNLRQVLDLGHQFQSINASVKLKDLTITANREDSRYFDVVYKLVALAVPATPQVAAEEPRNFRDRKQNPSEENNVEE